MKISHLLACRRAFSLICIFTFIIIVQTTAQRLGFRKSYRWGHLWHKWCQRAIGMEVQVHGATSTDTPTLFASNHVSYLDIPALGSVIDGTFIAKAEIENWPIFGLLCKLQRTIFIQRDRRRIIEQREEIYGRLREGDNLIFFPEGTSHNGTFVLPFKSALFSAAEWEFDGKPLKIQPVSIAYSMLDGVVLGRRLRPTFAWYGDMAMAGHLWQLLGTGKLGIDIIFHEAIDIKQFGSRKLLSDYCERVVARGVSSALVRRVEIISHPIARASATRNKSSLNC
ncbi:MAG: 1-acyl-sn-glycerol-3-phosphate acyltransferase [Rhodospirillaceae bacterium]|nr:1-acyl-sn-glycerol-3-phosphate acyltransferase [Rhodospirillaceae bacterium]